MRWSEDGNDGNGEKTKQNGLNVESCSSYAAPLHSNRSEKFSAEMSGKNNNQRNTTLSVSERPQLNPNGLRMRSGDGGDDGDGGNMISSEHSEWCHRSNIFVCSVWCRCRHSVVLPDKANVISVFSIFGESTANTAFTHIRIRPKFDRPRQLFNGQCCKNITCRPICKRFLKIERNGDIMR